MYSAKKLTTIAILVSLAVVLHIFEAFIPNPFPLPGIKLGLANIVTLFTLYAFGFRTGMQVVMLRTILGSLLSGTFLTTAFFLSFSGAVMSTLIMALIIYFFSGFSIIGISVAGAAAHNIGQLAAAVLIIEHVGIFFYLPMLLLSSIPTGIVTGFLVQYLIKSLKSSGWNFSNYS